MALRSRRNSRLAAFFLISLALTACGGGGGGGGGGGSTGAGAGGGSGGGGSSPPLSSDLRLTSTNANAVAARVFGAADELGILLENITQFAWYLRAGFFSSGHAETCDNGGTFLFERADLNDNMMLDAGDGLVGTLDDCDGRYGSILVAVTAFEEDFSVLSGDVLFAVDIDPTDSIAGEFTLNYTAGPTSSRWSTGNAAVEWTSNGQIDSFTAISYTKTAQPAGTTVAFAGALDSETLGGELSFSMSPSYFGAHGEMPSSGELRISGANSALRITNAPTADAAALLLDADGNGSYETESAVPWLDLFAGAIFEVGLPAIDVSSAGFSPPVPIGGEFIRVSTNLESRYPRDVEAIAYTWSVNGVLLDDATSQFLSNDIVRRDDVLEGTVQLTDGVSTVVARATAVVANAPPFVSSIVTTPQDPFTTDTIVVTPGVIDADGDVTELSYEWLRNGEVLPGETGPALAPDLHRKDDVIEVIVSVSDGFDSDSGRSGRVTIQDSPPTVEVASAPMFASVGDLVTFDASIFDADDDPVDQFQLYIETGPGGMTIDPATGEVSWTPGDLPFDSVVDVAWGIRATGIDEDPVAGTIRVTDPSAAYPLWRVGSNPGRVEHYQLLLGDFDGDNQNTLLAATEWGAFEYVWDGTGFSPVWAHPFALGAETGPADAIAARDLDADGFDEIFLADAGAIAVIDGYSREIEAELRLADDESCHDLAVADLSANGNAELVCAMTSSFDANHSRLVVVYDASSLTEIWRSDNLYGDGEVTIDVGNVDADPQLEIVHAWGKVYDGSSYALQWDYGTEFGRDVTIGDVDGDGAQEIVAANGDIVHGYDAVSRADAWQLNYPHVRSIDIAELDGSGGAELWLARTFEYDVSVHTWDAVAQDFVMLHQLSSFATDFWSILAGDVDNDGQTELVASPDPDFFVVGFNPAAEIEFPTAVNSHRAVEPPYTGGLAIDDGDGTKSLLFSSNEDSHTEYFDLGRLDPDTGLVTETLMPRYIASDDNRTVISAGDYDCDFIDEVMIATTLDYHPHFIAYDHLAESIDWRSYVPDPVPLDLPQRYQRDVGAVDLTLDGCAELVSVNDAGLLRIFDIGAAAEIWSGQTAAAGTVDFEIADLEGDGDYEIVTSAASGLEIFDIATMPLNLESRATFPLPSGSMGYFGELELGDADGDGVLEIFVLNSPSIGTARLYHLDSNLNLIAEVPTAHEARALLFDASTPAPQRNVLVAGAHIAAIDVYSGKTVWRGPDLIGRVGANSLNLVDFEDGSGWRVGVGTDSGMLLTR